MRQIATDLKQPQYLTQVITDWSQQPGQPDRKLLMVIDQFEELVTLTPGQNQAQTAEKSVAPDQGCTAFLEVIRQALSAHPQQLRVLLTLRSDFEPRFLTSPLQDWWQYARFPVRPMNSDELREAIEGPAQIQALYFEPSDLVGTLTDEVGQMPGALPLLSFTLSELYNELAEKWRKQEVSDRALCLEDYNKLGGVVGSLSKRATEEYENLVSDSEGFGAIVGKTYQATMQRLMLRMVTIEGGNVARRRVLLTELEYPTTAENRRVEVVVERLVTARLLVRGQEAEVAYVEPAHDFLVRGWDKLQKWLKDEQETLTLQQRLTPAATDWNTRRQDELPVNWREKTLALGDRSVFYIVEFVQSRRRKALQKRRAKAAKIIRKDSIGYLWDEDPRLEQLNRLVGAQDSWFNRTEDLFVRQSVVQKEKNWIGKLLLAVGITVLTGVLLRWVLLSQKDKLLEQVRASRESAEANLQSDHELEAMIDTLRAGKTLNDPLNLLNPYLWTAPAEVEAEVKETLFKVLSTARERNRLQLNRAAIYNVAVNPQGDELATTEDDDTVRLWDRSGRQLDQFPTGQGGVKSVAFNLDGNQLATGGENGTVLLWTIKDRKIDLTQKPIEIFKAHKGELPEGAILSLAFSQNRTDNQRLAIVDSNLKIWLWNLTKSRMSSANAELQKNSANTHIYSVTFNPDREQLATVGDDDTVELWDVVTGKQLDRFSTGQKIVYSVAFRDGNHLATGGAGKKVKLWTIGDDRKLDQSVEPESITTEQSSTYSLSFSRSGLLATVGNDEAVTIHTGVSNLTSDPKIQPARGNRQDVEVQGLAFSPNGKLIATVSADNQLRLWDLAGSQVARYQVGGKNVDGVAFSPNGELIATGAEDGTIELRDTQGNFLDRVSLDELQQSKLASIVFEPRGQRLAAIAESGVVEWLAIENQTFKKTGEIPVIERFQAPIKGIQRLAFAPNLRQVAVLQTSGVVSLWDYPSKKFRFILQTNKQRVSGITFSPNGQSLATAHPDGTVKLWQIERNADETITAIRPSSLEFQTHQGAIKNIAFSRINSNLLVTGGQDGTARIWDIATGQPPQFFLPSLTHPASAAPAANLPEIIKQAAFSPDAQRLATLGADQKLKLWHVDEQNLIQLEQELPLTPKQQLLAPVKSLVFSLDSALLAVIRQDETLQIWDTALEQWLDPIQSAPGHRITSLRFSPDHQHFVVLEQDQNDQGTLRLYRRNPSAEKGFDLQDLSNTELKQMNMSSVAFNPTGSQLATARLTEEGTGGIVTVWNQNIDTKTAEFKTQHPISDLIFNQNGQLATFETDGTVKLWDLDDGKQEVGEFKASDPSDILEPDFTLPLNLSDLLPSVQPAARPPTSPRPIQSVPPPTAPQPPQPLPTQRRFSADGRLLAIVNHGKLSLWNALGNPLNLPSSAQQTQAEPVLSAAFDTEGKRLITLDQEGKLSFWQVGSVADLLTESCHLLQDYLKNTPTLNPSDRDLCSDILPPPDSENTSAGEQLLVAKITNSEKQAGVEAMAASDFAAASQHFQTALTVKRNDPETRIYWSNAQIRNQPSYTIAVAVPISSDADGAQEILRGVAQAQYEVNQAGGIRGNLLRILIADDQGSDEMARQTAQELVANPDVLGVVGHFSSNSTLAAGAIYNQNQLVAISPVSTSIALSNFGSFLFRTVPNDQQAAQKLATYMLHQLNLHQPALFYNSQSNYSLSLRSKFQSALPSSEQIKGDFDVSSPYFNAAESVTQAIDDGADVLVLLTNTAQLNNALAVVTANQHHLPLLAGDDIYSLKTLQQGKEDALGLVISVPWSINSAPPDFVATSNRLWQATVNWRTALSYDATKAIVEAIQRSGENPTRPKIATILHSDNFFILGASGKVAFQSSGDRAPESSLDRSLVQVVKSGRSRSGTGYDFETIDLPK
ncbi:MAG TPA: ABC transporter substrate-binding protein [Coleofasciculaceae cyanobacterium]